MHRRMPGKKYVFTMSIAAAVLISLLSGCAGKREDESLFIDLTETEAPEEASEDMSEEAEDEPEKTKGKAQESAREEIDPDKDISETICIHVCGEVMNPGVYMLPPDSRLYEAVEAAGGLRDSAAGEYLNQASLLEDGQQIYVPSKEEAAQGMNDGQRMAGNQGTAAGVKESEDGRINLNTASKEQLTALSGIGEVKAIAIINYREEHGGFQKIEELMEVEGIKEGVFNKIKDQVKI